MAAIEPVGDAEDCAYRFRRNRRCRASENRVAEGGLQVLAVEQHRRGNDFHLIAVNVAMPLRAMSRALSAW